PSSMTRADASTPGTGWNSSMFTTPNSTVHAAIPSASDATAASVNPGRWRIWRQPWRRSWIIPLSRIIEVLFVTKGGHGIHAQRAPRGHERGERRDRRDQDRDGREDHERE